MEAVTPRPRGRSWRRLARVAPAALFILACGRSGGPGWGDYMAALRGEESGMTRAQQIAHLDRAILLEPREEAYRETRAIYEIDMHAYDRAAADLDTAITLADRPYLRFLHGLVTCQRGAHASSLADFDRAIAGQPANAQFYRGRSLALSAVGRHVEALRDAERLVSLVPQQAESYYARGVALAGLGRIHEAIADFDTALAKRPELVYPFRARGDARARAGDAEGARDDLEAAARLERDSGCAPCVDPFRY